MHYADNHCTYTEQHKPQHTYTFTGQCVVTHKSHSVTVPAEELFAYRQGKLIQDAMPSVNKDDREFLISGISPEGWEIMFQANV
jgi:hypothetical protein